MITRQQQKAATAQRIFEAALELFVSQGYEATTIEQITNAAGVAKGTFFVHFNNKEAILGHIGAIQMERLLQMIATDPAFQQRPLREQLLRLFQTLANTLEQQPKAMRELTLAVIRHSLLDLTAHRIDQLDQLLIELLAAAQQRGEIRGDQPISEIAVIVRGCYFLALFRWIEHQEELRLSELVVIYLDLCLHGVLRKKEIEA